MLVPSWHNCSALEHLFVLFYFWTKVHSFIHSHKVYWELWWLITDYWYNHFRIKRFIFVWSFFIVYRIIKTITNHSWLLLLLEAVTMPPPWLILHFFFVSCFIVPGRSRRHGHLLSPWDESLNWTVSVFVLTPYYELSSSSPITPAVAINWKRTLLQLLLKTNWVMQYCLWCCCAKQREVSGQLTFLIL